MKILILFLCSLISTQLYSQSILYTWSGGTGNWSDSSKWTPTGVPGATDTAMFIVTAPVSVCTINSNSECAKLYMLGSGTTASSGPIVQFLSTGTITLTVNDSLVITGGGGGGSGDRGGRPQLTSNGNFSAVLKLMGEVYATSSNSYTNGNAGFNMNEGTVIFGGTNSVTLFAYASTREGNLQIGDGINPKTVTYVASEGTTGLLRQWIISLHVEENCSFYLGSTSGTKGGAIGNYVVSSGINNLTGGIVIDSGATFAVNPTSGSWNAFTVELMGGGITNNGTLVTSATNRVLNINVTGTNSNTISGINPVTLHNISINTSNGLSLSRPVTITDTLLLQTGTLTVGSNTLSISNGGRITQTGGNLASGSDGGTVAFLGDGTVSGSLTFNNLSASGAITNSGTVTIKDVFQINTNGAINGTPIYSGTAALIYNTGFNYDVWNEWTGTGAVGSGVPYSVTIQNGTTLNMRFGDHGVPGDITISNGSLVLNAVNGSLALGGNWTRGSSGTFTPNGRPVIFNGTSSQSISGVTVFDSLTIDNSLGIILNANATVNQALIFNNGKITTGANLLSIGSSGSISGASSSRYVVGNLKQYISTGVSTARTLEIGDATNYTPIGLSFSNVSVTGGISATTTAGLHPQLSTSGLKSDKTLNRYYTLSKDGSLAFNTCTATFNFVPSDIIGGADPSSFQVEKCNSGSWSALTTTNQHATNIQATGITSFSEFVIGEPKATIIPNYNSVWEASSHRFPDEVSPRWALYDQSGSTDPIFQGDTLVINTTAYSDNIYYLQVPLIIVDTMVIEFKMKYISGTSDAPFIRVPYCAFVPTNNYGNILNIGDDEIFIYSSYNVKGPTINLDTKLGFHIYRIEVYNGSTIKIFYDGGLVLSGSTVYCAPWTNPQISWGDGTGNAYGESRWLYLKHNAAAFNNSISGINFKDLNANGMREPVDTGLTGWTINLEGPTNGKALNFDGVNDYVSIANGSNFNTHKVTAEAWVYLTKNNPGGYEASPILSRENSAIDRSWLLYMEWDGSAWIPAWFISLNGSDIAYTGYSGYSLNNGWHHIAGTYDSNTVRLYVDGVNVSSNTTSGILYNNNLGIKVGARTSYSPFYFKGNIDEARIWNRALSANEIKQNMYRRLTGSESGLIAYYGMDTVTSNTITDLTGHGNTGTLFNGTGTIPSAAPLVGSQTTDPIGFYGFTNLPNGSYTISESRQENWIETNPPGMGLYQVDVGANSQIIGKDFGNTYGYKYIGPSTGAWSDTSNWSGHQAPGPTNPAVIPKDIVVTVDTLPSDSVLALKVEQGASLAFSDKIGKLTVLNKLQVDPSASIELPSTSDTTGIICHSDFVNEGTLSAGQSTITMAGNKLKFIVDGNPASTLNRNTFYKLDIAGDSTSTIGDISIANELRLDYTLNQRPCDTVFITSNNVNAIAGTGKIPQGTIVRSIASGSTGSYRFESQQTNVEFNGIGTYPSSVALTALPDTVLSSFTHLKWQAVGGIVDTIQNTIVVDSVQNFSKWAFAIPRPQVINKILLDTIPYGTPRVNRAYQISPNGGNGFYAQLKLRYNQNEVPPGVREDSLVLVRGPIYEDTVSRRWNMVSVPVNPKDSRKSTLFPHATSSAFTYAGGYKEEDTLRVGSGYWLKNLSVEWIRIYGDDRVNDTISVVSGWNMIGTLTYPISSVSLNSIPPGLIKSAIYGYKNGYYQTDTLYPMRGYWVKVSGGGKLVLNAPLADGTTPKSTEPLMILKDLNVLTIRDASGGEQELYYSMHKIEGIEKFELPPVPPAGIFDVRYATNTMVEAAEGKNKEVPLSISSANYPVIISWDVNTTGGVLCVNGKELQLHGENSIMIVDSKTQVSIRLSPIAKFELPEEFALFQNYPNPFNPLTVIRYQLPVNSVVSLKVYNVLGQVVATLTNEVQSAGYKTAEWNASNVASGVYFYRLEAVGTTDHNKSFTQVKKSLLLK